jgi:tetratricopeptide (TPR) repeat protein
MAEEWHISAELFRRFLRRQASKAENRRLVRHLLGECTFCSALATRLMDEEGYWFPKRSQGLAPEDYDLAFAAGVDFCAEETKRAAVLRLRGWGQWASIAALLPEERAALVLTDPTYRQWGFYRALLDAARWLGWSDPREAVEIVTLAIGVAARLDPAAVGGEDAATDLQAMAWAILGNARRLASDLEGAREALNEAWRLQDEGSGDPLLKAQIVSLDASYVRAMGDFDTAVAVLEEALTIHRAAGDLHEQGRILLQMGATIGYADPERGLSYLREALGLINTSREPRLELCAQHDLAYFSVDAGRPQAALAILDRARPLYQQFPDDWAQLRLHWLEGRIARGLEHYDEAAFSLRDVWQAFNERGRTYDGLMVAIELAETHAASGEYLRAATFAAEVYPILVERRLHRHALAAWLVLQGALERAAADELAVRADLFRQLSLYYRRTWHNPAEFTTE